ncbi:MAG TPA: response regulator transcription factor [Thermoanaerobaculia bacterium]|nr:response regulator transcription factor [Thermoanaerobaculia bacterium]
MSGGPPQPPRILLVEDEPSLVLALTDRLASEGYAVESATAGDEALARALGEPFDLIVLDVMLPGLPPGQTGFDVCRELRQRGLEVPILMLTARSQVVDRVVGLKLGADDYLTKPFEAIELSARIEALLRRARPARSQAAGMKAGGDRLAFGDVEVDFRRAEVRRGGRPVNLSALELKLLRYLAERDGEVVSREELLDRVWGYDAAAQTRTVDVHVASLRQKIEETPSRPSFLITVHRLGYKFTGGGEALHP